MSYLVETDTLGKKNWLVLVGIRHDQQFTLDSVINKLLNSWHSQLGLTLTYGGAPETCGIYMYFNKRLISYCLRGNSGFFT